MKRALAVARMVAGVGLLVAISGCFLIPTTPDDYSPITEVEAQEMLDVFGLGAATFDQLGDEPTAQELNGVVDWFLSQVNVRSASVNEEGVVWVQFECGLLGSLSRHRFADGLGSAQQTSQSIRVIPHEALTRTPASAPGVLQASGGRAVIFSPFASELVEDEGLRWWWQENCDTAREGLYQMGYADAQIDNIVGVDASLDAFRTLDRYNFVFILTHGSTGLWNQWLVLGEEPTRSSLADRWNGEASRRSIAITHSEGARRYQVNQRFFGDEDMEFPDSVVFLNACTSRKRDWLASALIDQGASSVFGWSNTTNAWFVQEAMRELLSSAAIPYSTMDQAYEFVDPMFPGTVHEDLNGDKRGFYKLSNGASYGDDDDATSPVQYTSDFIHDGDHTTSFSLRAWSESRNDLYAIGLNSEATNVSVGPIRDASGQSIDITDIAYSSSEDTLYGVSYGQLVRISLEGCSLAEQSTRTATKIGIGLNVLHETSALACDSTGNLYGGTVGGELLSIDRITGRATQIGTYGGGFVSSGDLAFDANDTLYGSAMCDNLPNDVLVDISTLTGAATLIGSIGYDRVFGLFFMGGDLYGVTADNELLLVDTTSGLGTYIRDLTFSAWGAQHVEDRF